MLMLVDESGKVLGQHGRKQFPVGVHIGEAIAMNEKDGDHDIGVIYRVVDVHHGDDPHNGDAYIVRECEVTEYRTPAKGLEWNTA